MTTTDAAHKRWKQRIDEARREREKQVTRVWRPLYDAWLGRLARHSEEPEPENRAAQFVDVVSPHLRGNEREVRVRVARINPGEDAAAKLALAETLGDQATALLRAIGYERDAQGRPGELAKIIANSLWGMGVALLGFDPPRGAAAVERQDKSQPPQTVDIDFALAGHSELTDAGAPYVRSIDPRRFLGDGSYNDFGQGDWFGIEVYLSLAEAKAAYPDYAAELKPTHKCAPTWSPSERGEGAPADDDGLVEFVHCYSRRPQRVEVVCLAPGCPHVVETRDLQLGIEGLPLRLLGYQWPEGNPYPVPPLARIHDPAFFECEFKRVTFAAGCKLRTGMLVDEVAHPGLGDQLAQGVSSGVYKTKGDPRGAIAPLEVGSLRREHLDLAAAAGESVERNTGLSDLALGRRERGDQTIPEIQARQAHISTRLANLTDPVRIFEGSIAAGVTAIAYAKLDLLHGLQLPLDDGPDAALAAFDAEQPLIGEILDYLFKVYVNDSVTNADELAELNQLLDRLPAMQPLVAQEGKMIRLAPLIESMLRKTRVQRAGEVLVDLPAPPAAPPQDGATAPPLDPQAELQQLYAQLQQLPEGDPNEEPILTRIAELTAALEQQPAAAA